ncbi:MAG: ArsR/SmtB family transcription factor [Anaerolineales bacterium]|jgi:DNA-binding transcriptional ArsR family regulator
MSTESLSWDLGTAYDFFISLHVLHNPDKFGLRGSWAAGVRSRLPHPERKTLELADQAFWIPNHWIYRLPEPKDSQGALDALAAIPAADRLPQLALRPIASMEERELLLDVRARGAWDSRAADGLKTCLKSRGHSARQEQIETILNAWAQAEETGAAYLQALQAYREVFFAEEERRILPAVKKAYDQARRLAKKLEIEALLEELSQGVRFEPPLYDPDHDLVLVPSFWSTPLVIYEKLPDGRWIFIFGARTHESSLVPGDLVPDTLLQALKALADPTRLRILRYLVDQPMTPTMLARKLRLRAPTVVHHLSELRLAGLVQLTVEATGKKSERRYAARMETLPKINGALQNFLSQKDDITAED